MCRGFGERRGFDNGGSGKVVVEDSLSVGFEDGFGGHCVEFEVGLLFRSCQHKSGANCSFADDGQNVRMSILVQVRTFSLETKRETLAVKKLAVNRRKCQRDSSLVNRAETDHESDSRRSVQHKNVG